MQSVNTNKQTHQQTNKQINKQTSKQRKKTKSPFFEYWIIWHKMPIKLLHNQILHIKSAASLWLLIFCSITHGRGMSRLFLRGVSINFLGLKNVLVTNKVIFFSDCEMIFLTDTSTSSIISQDCLVSGLLISIMVPTTSSSAELTWAF